MNWLQLRRAIDELGELWGVESKLRGKDYTHTQVFEYRGFDPENEILQVIGGHFKFQRGESG